MTLPAGASFRQHFTWAVDDNLLEALVLQELIEREKQLADDAGIGVFCHPLPYFVTKSDFG